MMMPFVWNFDPLKVLRNKRRVEAFSKRQGRVGVEEKQQASLFMPYATLAMLPRGDDLDLYSPATR
jgi:hypothetical protein